ncbi:MAG: hypothetical protein KA100_01860 [Rickettsiales bacterium]|nr:hypothetical protein [Rickettsiales bacterium]
MIKKILLVIFAVFVSFENSQAQNWNSAEGLKKLERSQFKNDFYQLANFYQPQENPLFCSIATGTIIRNALNYKNISSQKSGEMTRPDGSVVEYHLYSQDGFFNDKTEKVKKRAVIEFKEPVAGTKEFDAGVTLADFAQMLKIHGMKVELTRVEKNDAEVAEKFRNILKANLAEDKKFLVLNFDGKVLGKATRGHVSPLVAFDEASDSVLVLDVALHKNQWYWVEVSKLIEAMNTKDAANYRGYLVVGK